MDRMVLRIFQRQVRDQCRFVLMSGEILNSALPVLRDNEQWPDGHMQAMDQILYALQNLLTAAANISKALWGSGGKLEEQRRPLRESLGVSDDSPLRSTSLRNHFEHFDERVDVWDKKSTSHNHVDRLLGPSHSVAGNAIDDVDRFRNYDPATGIATFWGQEHDIAALAQAAADLLPVAEQEAKKPHWE